MKLAAAILIFANVDAALAEGNVTNGSCSPIVRVADSVHIVCNGIPEEAIAALVEEIRASNLALNQANERAEKWASRYFDVVDKYSKIAAFMTDDEREEAAELIAKGSIIAAESDLSALRARVIAAKENARAEMAQTMQQIAEFGLEPGGIVADYLKWDIGSELKVCFFDGSDALKKIIAEIATNWTLYGNISFDFGYSLKGYPQTCDDNGKYDIRVSLEPNPPRNGSYIGKLARRIGQDQPTMWLHNHDQQTALHEFGHALGLRHMFFHPESCVQEIDSAAAVDYFARNYGWSASKVRANLRFLPGDATRYSILGFDTESIMQFKLPDVLFNHPDENCTKSVKSLSLQDKLAVFRIYPI